MFGSQILEVGIGLILVFLLVSLILTAVREAIESVAKTRSRDLELAIAELLNDREGTGLRKQLYEHPLVFSLFPGGVQPTRFSATGKVKHRPARNAPSYIPREIFSSALQDILKREADKAGHLGKAYQALLASAANDVDRARKGIEQWYDASMDRASGWFKRRTQMLLLVLGVLVAVALNINAITIGQYLATNEAARTQLADIAAEVEREQAAKAGQPASGDGQADAATETSDGGNVSSADNSSAAAPSAGRPQLRDDELARRLDARVRTVGLPIGWDQVQLNRITAQFRDNWVWAVLNLIIGYLIVGFAATLGAPFWFDLLGKFMVVRSTVKPTEKSPDEASKDGGTGGSPKPRPQDDEEEEEEGGGRDGG